MSLLLTISIVVYRKYEDVLCAISSIEKFTDWTIKKKIYIIDNSCYPPGNVARHIFVKSIEEYPDIEYIDTQRNLGFGKGHNYVLNSLDSKYHAIVNPDILLTEDVFTELLEFMKDHSIGMSIPRMLNDRGYPLWAYRQELTVADLFIRMFGSRFFPKRFRYHTLRDENYSKPFQVPFGQGSFLLVRTALLKKLGGFDDRYFMYVEDADLCKRVNKISKVMYCPYATVIHKWEKASHTSLKLFCIHIHSMLSYFNKWGWRWI